MFIDTTQSSITNLNDIEKVNYQKTLKGPNFKHHISTGGESKSRRFKINRNKL